MRTTCFLIAGVLSGIVGEALAQPPAVPLVRADVLGTVGWLNVTTDGPGTYDDWHHRGLFGGGGLGWHWTDHLKTELDAGASSEAEFSRVEPVPLDGTAIYVSARVLVRMRRLALTQQYQFFRNAWFHPHVAAGLDWTWERTRELFEPAFWFDGPVRPPRPVLPPGRAGPHTRLVVRPVAAAGFKAYMTPRTFFRSDVRVAVQGGIDEVLWRFGLGVDF
jgi:hypothetical protein